MSGYMVLMLLGAIVMGCFTAGLFFVRFWRVTADRLFLFFAFAFWVLGAQWAALGVLELPSETRHFLYVPRLIAFLLILAGIADKNRSSRSGMKRPRRNR